MVILKYWKQLVLLAMLVGAFFAGKTWESNYRDSILLKERNEAIAAYEKEAQRAYKLGKELEKERAKRQTREAEAKRELAEVINRSDVYSRDCINDDGLHIINEVLSGKPTSSERSVPMPAANPVTGEDR